MARDARWGQARAEATDVAMPFRSRARLMRNAVAIAATLASATMSVNHIEAQRFAHASHAALGRVFVRALNVIVREGARGAVMREIRARFDQLQEQHQR